MVVTRGGVAYSIRTVATVSTIVRKRVATEAEFLKNKEELQERINDIQVDLDVREKDLAEVKAELVDLKDQVKAARSQKDDETVKTISAKIREIEKIQRNFEKQTIRDKGKVKTLEGKIQVLTKFHDARQAEIDEEEETGEATQTKDPNPVETLEDKIARWKTGGNPKVKTIAANTISKKNENEEPSTSNAKDHDNEKNDPKHKKDTVIIPVVDLSKEKNAEDNEKHDDEDLPLDADEQMLFEQMTARHETYKNQNINQLIPNPIISPNHLTDFRVEQMHEAMALQSEALGRILQNQESKSDGKVDKFISRQAVGKNLPQFYGRPEEWPLFIAEYERTNQVCGLSDSENMIRLQKCLKGEALKSVQCLMGLSTNVGKVMDTLKRRFGRVEHIIFSLTEKVKTTPPVKEDKLETIIEFGGAVINLLSTIKSLGAEDHLSNPSLLHELKNKLPATMKLQFGQWLRGAEGRKEDLEHFAEWIEDIMDIACSYCPPSSSNTREEKTSQSSWKSERKGFHHTSGDKYCYLCDTSSHFTNKCRKLTNMSPDERSNAIATKKLCFCCFTPGHFSRVCPEKTECGKDGCKQYHDPILHGAAPRVPWRERQQERQDVNALNCPSFRYVKIKIKGPLGEEMITAMQDDGSGATIMNDALAKRIGITGVVRSFCVGTVNGDEHYPQSQIVSASVSAEGKEFNVDGIRTIDELKLSPVTLDTNRLKKRYPLLKNIPLTSFKQEKPQMIIGNCHFDLIQHLRVVKGKTQDPIAIKSRLGWSVILNDDYGRTSVTELHHHYCEDKDEELHQLVKRSFTTEDFGVKVIHESPRSKEDLRAMEIMKNTTKRVENEPRFETGLLWKNENVHLPESYGMAHQRLKCQERKMDKDPVFAAAYCAKMEEYVEKGYIKKLSEEELLQEDKDRSWYLPHFGVMNPNKPGKLRLVFDAKAKSNGVSLNDVLCQGPDLNNSLVGVLVRFRQYQYAFAGDAKDMFHRVYIREEDRCAQKFLWRGMEREKKPETWQMKVMIFGATSSPSSAQYVKNLNAEEHEKDFAEAANAIKRNNYVDDNLGSRPTMEDSVKLINDVIKVQDAGGFQMCNWTANDPGIIKEIPEDLRAKELQELDLDNSELPDGRILGLWWNPTEDYFGFKVKYHKVPEKVLDGSKRPTKREVLRTVMSVFDPLGFVAHVTVKAKILLQDIWRTKIGWDDEITSELEIKWKNWLQDLHEITGVKVPRCYSLLIPEADKIELHIFCDASEKAFAAICYIRVIKNGEVQVNHVMAKTRVSPLKPLSIPRLELQAAVMGVRMACCITAELEIVVDGKVYWTDSTTVLRWIRSDARRFKQFVSHRLGEISESSEVEEWRWIPTKLNVADDATRDDKPSAVEIGNRWFRGEEFLWKDEEHWPKEDNLNNEGAQEVDDPEMKTEVHAINIMENPSKIFLKYSSYYDMIRDVAYVRRCVDNWKLKKGNHVRKEKFPWITAKEFRGAEDKLIKLAQKESFREEIELLNGGKPVPRRSKLYPLIPFMDKDGFLRMKGRTEKASFLPYETKNPVILDKKHPYTKLLVSKFHEDLGHYGIKTICSEIQQKYYIIGLTSAVKKAFRECQKCMNQRAAPAIPIMGSLPEERLEPLVRPFTNTGMDYYGPMEVTIGRRHEKRYGVIFTCLSTRAVHLEVAHDLTADSAINAIRRMAGRRGQPKKIWSDNGTNFQGANKELKKALKQMDQSKMVRELTPKGTQWIFNPPSAPHMGGVWEILVKGAKKVLGNLLEGESFPEETLTTFIVETEAILNKRPLVEISMDPEDRLPLTPWDILVGRSDDTEEEYQVPGDFTKDDLLLKKKWRAAQAMTDEFWRRWIKEYLPSLNKRAKWHDTVRQVKKDDIVLIVDNQSKRNHWSKGRVIKVCPGKDGIVRTVKVKTSTGVYKRPVAQIAVLNLRKDEPEFIGGKDVKGKKQ